MRPIVGIIFAATVLTGSYTFSAAQQLTPQQYHKEKGPCACPDDVDKAGQKCGKRSAYCRSGGAEIKGCFRVDVQRRTKEACG